MTKEEKSCSASGEHAQTIAVERLFEAIDASTRAQNLGTAMTRRVFWMLAAMAGMFAVFSVYSGAQADRSQTRQEAFAAKLELIAEQVSTVQATADSTKTSVAVLEERPAVDLEIVDAPPSAASGPAQPTAIVVIRKPRAPASQTPSASFTIPIPLPSVPSGAAPEPKR